MKTNLIKFQLSFVLIRTLLDLIYFDILRSCFMILLIFNAVNEVL